MIGLPRRIVFACAAAAVLLLVINLWLSPPNQSLQASPTSFGVASDGYEAAYLLLSESGMPAARSYLPPAQVSTHKVLWFVSPMFLDAKNPAGKRNAKQVLEWVRKGATAVVFGDPDSDWKRLDIERSVTSSADPATVVSGDWTRLPRSIKVAGLMYFGNAGDHARVRLRAGNAAFAIEFPLGAGKLIAIADGRFLRNHNLAESDDSVLLVELARAIGPVTFDERCHGLAEPISIFAAVGDSRAVLPLVMGFVLVLLWVGEQRSWPRRTLPPPAEGIAPSIVSFVEALGTLYSRARDPGAAFSAYRTGFLHRLRREISPRAEIPEHMMVNRIERDRTISEETRRWLSADARPRNESELVAAVRAIESYPGVGR